MDKTKDTNTLNAEDLEAVNGGNKWVFYDEKGNVIKEVDDLKVEETCSNTLNPDEE